MSAEEVALGIEVAHNGKKLRVIRELIIKLAQLKFQLASLVISESHAKKLLK